MVQVQAFCIVHQYAKDIQKFCESVVVHGFQPNLSHPTSVNNAKALQTLQNAINDWLVHHPTAKEVSIAYELGIGGFLGASALLVYRQED